jgi:uncharacterized membrane protein YhaH (DUF805 family)
MNTLFWVLITLLIISISAIIISAVKGCKYPFKITFEHIFYIFLFISILPAIILLVRRLFW